MSIAADTSQLNAVEVLREVLTKHGVPICVWYDPAIDAGRGGMVLSYEMTHVCLFGTGVWRVGQRSEKSYELRAALALLGVRITPHEIEALDSTQYHCLFQGW